MWYGGFDLMYCCERDGIRSTVYDIVDVRPRGILDRAGREERRRCGRGGIWYGGGDCRVTSLPDACGELLSYLTKKTTVMNYRYSS